MLENRSMLEFGKQLSIEALHDVEAAHDIKVQKQKLAIEAQNAEADAHEIELDVVQKEFGYLQATLEQRQNKIAEMHEEIKAETCQLYEQRKVLSVSFILILKLQSKINGIITEMLVTEINIEIRCEGKKIEIC